MSTEKRSYWLNVVFPTGVNFGDDTEGLVVPAGFTAERPSSPINGTIRYNTSGAVLEAFVNGNWENLLSGGAGSVNEFTDLTDTFPDYVGRATQLLRVNAAETGIESIASGNVFLPKAGGTMDTNANITMDGGEILGLPPTPTTANAAASKFYVDGLIGGIPSRIQNSNGFDNFIDTEDTTLVNPGIRILSHTGTIDHDGGPIFITTGAGSYSTPNKRGGTLRIGTGVGGTGTGFGSDPNRAGVGGDVQIRAGTGGNSGTATGDNGGRGGDISIDAGKGGVGDIGGTGGNIFIRSGEGYQTLSGSIFLQPSVGPSFGNVYIGASNLIFPNNDGNAGDVLTTDGTGDLSFSPSVWAQQTWSSNLSPAAIPVGNPIGTGQRVDGVVYTNNTGSPIVVNVVCQANAIVSTSLNSSFLVDGIIISRYFTAAAAAPGATSTHSVTVPNGSTYVLSAGTPDYTWYELS